MSIREIRGLLYHNYHVPSDSPIAQAIAAEGRRHGTAVRAAGSGHSFGSPHVHAWLELVDALHQLGEKVGAKTAAEIAATREAPEEMIVEAVQACRLSTTRLEGTSRIQLAIRDPKVAATLRAALVQMGAEFKPGTALWAGFEQQLEGELRR